jgi:hypothetical protein
MAINTTGTILKQLRAEGYAVDRNRVAYLLRKGEVKPLGRAGIVNVYPDEAVDIIRVLLSQSADVPLDLTAGPKGLREEMKRS